MAATSTLAAAVTTDLRQYQASVRGCIQRASAVHAGRGDAVAVCSDCRHQQVRQLQQGHQHERPAAHMNRNGDDHVQGGKRGEGRVRSGRGEHGTDQGGEKLGVRGLGVSKCLTVHIQPTLMSSR